MSRSAGVKSAILFVFSWFISAPTADLQMVPLAPHAAATKISSAVQVRIKSFFATYDALAAERTTLVLDFYGRVISAWPSDRISEDEYAHLLASTEAHFEVNKQSTWHLPLDRMEKSLQAESEAIAQSLRLGYLSPSEAVRANEVQQRCVDLSVREVTMRLGMLGYRFSSQPREVVAIAESVLGSVAIRESTASDRERVLRKYGQYYCDDLLAWYSEHQSEYMKYTTESVFYSGSIKASMSGAAPKSQQEVRRYCEEHIRIDASGNIPWQEVRVDLFGTYIRVVTYSLGISQAK